jgi:hypothetical protein
MNTQNFEFSNDESRCELGTEDLDAVSGGDSAISRLADTIAATIERVNHMAGELK